MMTLPPFLVPRGMDWDPIKKRFFKKLPAQAKVENVDLSSSQKIQKKDKAEHLKSLQPSSIDAKPSRSSLGQSLTTYNSAPNHLLTQQRRRAAIQTSLGHAKHVSTTLIIPWARQGQDVNSFPNSDGCVTLLHSMPALGSIMCLSNKDRTPFFLDTSHVTQLESSSAETLLFSLLGAVNIVTEYSDIRSLSDRLFFNMGSEGEANNITSFKGDYAASVWGGFLNFGRLSNRDSQSKKSPCIKRIFQARISKKDHQYDHLCFQILRSADLTLEEEECFLAYAVQREVTVIYVKYSGDANTPENDKPPLVILALQIMESDITAIQFLPSGIVLLVGLRNGTILYFSTREFLEKKGPKIRDISTASSQKLPVFGEGAVTHIQAVSDHEIVIAYSSGEMFLVDPASRDEPIVCFHGHINSWSLNLPMTIDIPHRLLAVAGQDCRVRIWSLDHPLPLHYSKTLYQETFDDTVFSFGDAQLSIKTIQQMTFSAPITALAFCQRRYMANMEAKANVSGLPRGLPALAVSCGSEIGFFE